jgi:hypothetical protein
MIERFFDETFAIERAEPPSACVDASYSITTDGEYVRALTDLLKIGIRQN